MARRKSLGSIIIGLQRTWSPAQITERTGVPHRIQTDIKAGRTSGATYEESLRKSNRYDIGKTPSRVRPLAEAKAVQERKAIDQEMRDLTKPLDFDASSYANRLNYRRDVAAAERTAKARGVSDRAAKTKLRDAIRSMNAERKRGSLSKDADGPLAEYLYLTGRRDHLESVES